MPREGDEAVAPEGAPDEREERGAPPGDPVEQGVHGARRPGGGAAGRAAGAGPAGAPAGGPAGDGVAVEGPVVASSRPLRLTPFGTNGVPLSRIFVPAVVKRVDEGAIDSQSR